MPTDTIVDDNFLQNICSIKLNLLNNKIHNNNYSTAKIYTIYFSINLVNSGFSNLLLTVQLFIELS